MPLHLAFSVINEVLNVKSQQKNCIVVRIDDKLSTGKTDDNKNILSDFIFPKAPLQNQKYQS